MVASVSCSRESAIVKGLLPKGLVRRIMSGCITGRFQGSQLILCVTSMSRPCKRKQPKYAPSFVAYG